MKKMLGFTSFEFYFVLSVIGLILLFAINRYLRVAEETKQLSFGVIAKHFNTAIHSHRARWIMARQTKTLQLDVDGLDILFTPQGWPLAVLTEKPLSVGVSVSSCLSLWNHLLQNPPSISSDGGEAFGSRIYHLSVLQEGACRYELITESPGEFYFEYSPLSGRVIFHGRPISKNN